MEKLLIYLDIDGVLNNNNWELKVFEEKGYYPIDRNELSKDNLENFKYLINELQTKYVVEIILSSSWRWYPETFEAVLYQLAEIGLTLAGTTDIEINTTLSRSMEIKNHLQQNWKYQKILILDDMPLDKDLKNFQIQTNLNEGLTKKLADEALCLLL